jgi:oligoendopeptidase F
VNRHLPTFHRYLKLRKRMMGITDDLHYYDLYAPLVSSVDLRYTPEEAQKHVLQAFAPLGKDYQAVVQRAFKSDGSTGSRRRASGRAPTRTAAPTTCIRTCCSITWGSTTTSARWRTSSGHTMHSYFSNKTQPYPTADYATFVAEVASTFNEALLIDHMLKQIKDTPTRLSLLGNYLENIKATVFRQTQFAEFELKMHEMAEKGQPITGDALAKLYLDITRRYYGHDQKITVVDDYIAHEWSFIPHFYRDFYVFQYATSFTAAEALSAKVLSGDQARPSAIWRSSAPADRSIRSNLLKDAGVDMTTDEPLNLTIRRMNQVMDEMEKLLAK